ncbi:Protein of unknown function DUF538 [Dillenia turbinata]|uniref:Uncharacterized protein n=1 Tax=Dillenia turbinata TaxID=194707 RepID=A0AAN8V189_9MAGN
MKFNRNPQLGLLILFLISLYLLPISSSISLLTNLSDNTTVYEILPKFGLPKGLLPDSVSDYALTDDGSFVVTLPKPCYVQFDYLVYYESQITGQLKYGSIKNLKGIQVQRFFLWFDVDEIKVDLPPSDNIYFQVGLINKKLDAGQFQSIHSCRDSVAVRCGVPVFEGALAFAPLSFLHTTTTMAPTSDVWLQRHELASVLLYDEKEDANTLWGEIGNSEGPKEYAWGLTSVLGSTQGRMFLLLPYDKSAEHFFRDEPKGAPDVLESSMHWESLPFGTPVVMKV